MTTVEAKPMSHQEGARKDRPAREIIVRQMQALSASLFSADITGRRRFSPESSHAFSASPTATSGNCRSMALVPRLLCRVADADRIRPSRSRAARLSRRGASQGGTVLPADPQAGDKLQILAVCELQGRICQDDHPSLPDAVSCTPRFSRTGDRPRSAGVAIGDVRVPAGIRDRRGRDALRGASLR